MSFLNGFSVLAYWYLAWGSKGVDECVGMQGVAWFDFMLPYTSLQCVKLQGLGWQHN